MRHVRPAGAPRRPRPTQDIDIAGEAAVLGDIDSPPTGAVPLVDEGAPDDSGAPVPAAGAKTGLGRASMLMASGTAVSRGLGLVRNALLVAAIGTTGMAADAFDVANRIPNFAFAIIATGVLNAVLVPQIVRAYRSRNPQEHLDKLLTLSATILLAITTLLTAASSLVVALYAGNNWTPEQTSLAVAFAFWCTPQLFFYGLYTLLGQVLNARKQFGPFMWAPAMNNIVSIVGFGIFILLYGGAATGNVDDMAGWDSTKIAVLAGTATLGIVAQALILFVPLWRSGFRWNIRFGFRGIGLRTTGKVAMWTLLAAALEQVGGIFITNFASAAPGAALEETFGAYAASPATSTIVAGLAAGAPATFSVAGNAAYTQALMIYLLPHSLVTVSIATALFTAMSSAADAGDVDTVRADLSRGLRTIGVFTVFATALMVVLATPITKVIVPSLSAAGNVAVSQVLVTMSLGLVPLGAMVLMKWVYFAFGDGATVFRMQVPTTLVLVVVSWAITRLAPAEWWVAGVGLAMSLANLVAVLGRSFGLRKTLRGLDGFRVLRLHVKVTVSALVAAAGGFGILLLLGTGPSSFGRSLLLVVLGGAVMTAIYVGGLKLLRVREFDDLIRPFARKFGRLRRR